MEKLSVAVITFNEEENIGACLETVSWADEIVIVDSFSTDKTVEIARRYTDKVYQQAWAGYSRQKNCAAAKATHPWILTLDADDRIPPDLALEIQALLSNEEIACVAYEFPFKVFFRKRWVRHGGFFPEYKLRLFRKDRGRFADRLVHEKVSVTGPVGRLQNCAEHHSYRSISDFIQRLDRYSTLSARQYYEEGRLVGWPETVLRAWFTFVQMYLLRKGFLDGGLGFFLAVSYSYYTFAKYAKLRELYETKGSTR